MSQFEERVQKIVDRAMLLHMQEHSEASPAPSRYGPDDIYLLLQDALGLAKETKSEVNKIEHLIPNLVPDEKKKKKKPNEQLDPEDDSDDPADKTLISRFWSWWKEQESQYSENTAMNPGLDDIFDDWLKRMEGFLPLIRSANEKTKFIISNLIRSWVLRHELEPIKKDLSTIIKQSKSTQAQLASCCSDMSAATQDIKDEVSSLQDQLTQCCLSMHDAMELLQGEVERGNSILEGVDQTTASIEGKVDRGNQISSDINSKVDLLNPVTNANNVLEILQRQKAIQASLDDIRRLL